MFEIKLGASGEIIMAGRFDASQAERAQAFMDGVASPRVVDLRDLDYISSAGLAVLLRTQKAIMPSGAGLRLVNVSPHIHDIFKYSGFDQIFAVEALRKI
jgi:anti-sigma B factor antagonist